MNPTTKLLLTQLVILILSAFSAAGQTDTTDVNGKKKDSPKRILTLFDSDEPIEISLEFDLKSFLEKKAQTETFDGLLTMRLSETDSMDRKVTLKYRGFSRYQNCGYPPVEINFK